MKSKAAVVALCVCVILAILGVVLGKSPALENTELPHSVSEEILSAEETSSESKASSAEVSTPAKAMTPKEEYESMYGKPQWLACDQTYHICVRKTVHRQQKRAKHRFIPEATSKSK